MRLLRDRNAVLFVGVSLVAGFGGTAMSLAAGLWALGLTGSTSLAALAAACVFAPSLLGPALGVLVDRLPRQPLLVGTSLGMAGLLLLLLAVRSADQLWLLYTVMLGYGVSYVLLDAGEAAVLPAALPDDQLGGLNGLRMSAQEGTKLIAPLVGAALFTWIGGPAVALLSAALLGIAAGLYAAIRTTAAYVEDRAPEPRPAGRSRDGVDFLRGHRPLRAVVLVASVTMLMSGLGSAVLYAVVRDGLHQPAAFAGVITSVHGVGSIIGGLLAGRLLDRYGELPLAGWAALVFAAGTALRCLPWSPAVLVSGVLMGVGLPWTVIAAMTAVQRRTPHALLGRVAATANSLVFAPTSIALLTGAGLLAVVDYRIPLGTAALGALLAGGWLLTRRDAEPLSVPAPVPAEPLSVPAPVPAEPTPAPTPAPATPMAAAPIART
ncbi:Na+/melibiose symporter-like transporter [Micromonospora pisi]|uniref:Na+/melibiose symporter-like transporter n=1 Tax=Micromonospora pisi TaxID=589240 RepID=A0A495JFZ5_9ACTN|nr:MFS transporter [Micromonospora pisi]RKR87916.1 Na+/melibiose symporter-like transporter [Micromonospora pisi]